MRTGIAGLPPLWGQNGILKKRMQRGEEPNLILDMLSTKPDLTYTVDLVPTILGYLGL